MKFFKPEDFELVKIYPKKESTIELADVCNAKLEREGRVVYLLQSGHPTECIDFKKQDWHTHKALLINIEPIEQCKHPAEKVSSMVKTVYLSQGLELEPKDFSDNSEAFYQCECGATVKPGSFVKVE